MFFRFIEERSFVSENDSSLEFFDECVDKVSPSNDQEQCIGHMRSRLLIDFYIFRWIPTILKM